MEKKSSSNKELSVQTPEEQAETQVEVAEEPKAEQPKTHIRIAVAKRKADK